MWSDAGKPHQDMVFLLIASTVTDGHERVFGLVVVWTHPYQASYHSLEEAAHKLVLLVDDSADWVYAFA